MGYSNVTRRVAMAGLAACGLALGAGAASAQETMRMLVAWNPGTTIVDYPVDLLIKELEAKNIKVIRQGPAVVPPFEQFEPVSKGAFDLHWGAGAYHTNKTAVGLIMDTVVTDLDKRRTSGIWDWLDKYYQTKHNVKILAFTAEPGLQFLLRRDLIGGQFNGMKIRSNPAYDEVIRAMGGTPVQLPPGEIYTALQKGLVDGIGWPQHSLAAYKFDEVAPFVVRPTYGGASMMWAMSLQKWNSLSPDMKKTFTDMGIRIEKAAMAESAKIAAADEAHLRQRGSKFVTLDDAKGKLMQAKFVSGIWDLAVKRSGQDARDLIDLIKLKDMALK